MLQEMKDGGSLRSPKMRQAAVVQMSLLLFDQSVHEVSGAGSLHKHQSFCQDAGSTFNGGAEATLFGPSAKPQAHHAPSLLASQSLRGPLSPYLSFFLGRKEEGKGNLVRRQLKSEMRL